MHSAYTRSNSLMEIMAARKSHTPQPQRAGGSSLKRGSGAEHRIILPRDPRDMHGVSATSYL